MGDLMQRLAGLSPERRRVLERLLTERGGDTNAASSALADPATQDATTFYDAINADLDRTDIGRFARFLNYGYVPDGSPQQAVVHLPPQALNKTSLQLVLELVGDCDLGARSVLDVGCGRGGLLETLAAYFAPRRLVGLDLCWRAVAFCASAPIARPTTFLQGDAQCLPFLSGSFDVVTNLESSHSYAEVEQFYTEVARILKPGGHFLYSDAVPTDEVPARLDMLRGVGLGLEVERDITANILLACEASAVPRLASFTRESWGETLDDFLGVPESAPYEALRDGSWVYGMYRFLRM